MNNKQYNNIIENTLKYEQSAQSEDSLATARAVFDNMGVALPSGDIKTVCETIKTNDYMGWRECSAEEAQEAANEGVAAIAINEDKIVVISATDEEEPVAQTASVMTLSENASAFAGESMQYYVYSSRSTNSGGNSVSDKPYDPNYPYVNIRTREQYYTTLNTYSYELRNDIVFQFTFEEINSLSMYLNHAIYENSTQQEKEEVLEDAISVGLTALSLGVSFIPIVGEYLGNILTGLDVIDTIQGVNKSSTKENIIDVISCINAFSHYVENKKSYPKPNSVTYTISLLKKSPLHGREIKIESSDGERDCYTLQNEAYDLLLAVATANTYECSMYKIAPEYTYFRENF